MILILTILLSAVAAQFQFFDNLFGQQQHQQHHQQPSRGQAWYNEQVLNTPCHEYLCPKTLACVHSPNDCECAGDQVSCQVGKHRICTSRQEGKDICAGVFDLMKGLKK